MKQKFPNVDATVKLSGGDQVLRTSTLIRSEEKDKKMFQENQTGLHHHFKTHRRMTARQDMISGPFQELFSPSLR